MRLTRVFNKVNQIEKSSFLKIVDSSSNEQRGTNKEIDLILSEHDGQIKNIDDADIAKLFRLTRNQFIDLIADKLEFNNFQLDILIDILIRDGNSIMSREWFSRLYDDEVARLKESLKSFVPQLDEDNKDMDPDRRRDYIIYRNCIKTAFENDEKQNREKHISRDEKTILDTLANTLELSLQEQRVIYYSIVGIGKIDIDTIINSLKEIGIVFYHRKTHTIFVPDEVIWILRDLVGIELPNKYFRRILRLLKDTEINRVAKRHRIDSKLTRAEKIEQILKQGVSATTTLLHDIHIPDTTKSGKKTYLQDLVQKRLSLPISKLGTTAEERIAILIEYFRNLDKDDNLGISIGGFEKLLIDMQTAFPNLNKTVKREYQLQQEDVLNIDVLTDYNLKPLDILDLVTNDRLTKFCDSSGIKKGSNIRLSILKNYKDMENLLLENYALIGKRDLNALREKGITIKESELGIKYEQLTKKVFAGFHYNVDDALRKQLNTKRTKMDVILNLGENEVIIIECKTVKGGIYTKYAAVSRQLKSYLKLCEDRGYKVVRIILVSDDFSDDFVNDCEYDLELNLSLITSSGLIKILDAFKKTPLKAFPTKLLQKEGKLDEDRIAQALSGKKAIGKA
ncbi:MAG: hypothetical protein GY845_02240 [Planctomycetes bacterium]|nr:hypothetical protein [Planctomycetota bacterium]